MQLKYSDPFWTSLAGTVDRIAPYVGIVLVIIAAFTFAQGSHAASYVFLLVAYIFLVAYVTRRLARREPQRNLVLAAIGVAALLWIAYNVYQDAGARTAVVPAPARSGETLVLLSEFDRRGGRTLDFTARVRDTLSAKITAAHLSNVRIDTVSGGQRRVGDRTAARSLGAGSNAAFVLWGWYDDVELHPDLVSVPGSLLAQDGSRATDFSPTEMDSAFVLRDGSPEEVTFVADLMLAQLLVRADRSGDALDVLAEAEDNANAAKLTSGLESVYFMRAVVQQLVGADLNLVVDAYSRALELNPQLAAAYYDRSFARAARGAPASQVFADYARAVDLEPRIIPFAYFSTGALPGAPGRPDTLAKLQDGIRAYEVGDYDGALDAYDAALALEPTYPGTYAFRARLYHVRREFQAAVDDYTRFLTAGSTVEQHYLAYTYYARALARRALGQGDLAFQDLGAYLDVAPPDDPLHAAANQYRASP